LRKGLGRHYSRFSTCPTRKYNGLLPKTDPKIAKIESSW
jgi:hypothetical protein